MLNSFKIFYSQAGTLNSGGGGGGTNIQKVGVDTSTPPGTNPVLANASNEIFVTGGQVAAGTTANVIQTNSLAANTFTIQVQRSNVAAVSTIGLNGVSHFNSADFTIDANGFVSIANFSPFHYVQTSAGTYVVTATDYYISCDPTANTITVQLPNAPTQFREFVIKDRTGEASTHNIFITTVGGLINIDGNPIYTLAGNFSSVQLLFNGVSFEIF